MIKAIIFDLYETLVTQSGVDVPRAGALGEALGLDPTAYRKKWKELRPLALRGELTFSEALTKVGATLCVDLAADRVEHACAERVRANTVVFEKADSELVALTRDLAGCGLRLATISNCIAEDVAAWPQCAFAPQFSCAVFSYAAGMVKPEAGIYVAALERLGVHAEEALYIGDGGDNELEGAESAGVRAAQATWFVSRADVTSFPIVGSAHDVMRLVLAGYDG